MTTQPKIGRKPSYVTALGYLVFVTEPFRDGEPYLFLMFDPRGRHITRGQHATREQAGERLEAMLAHHRTLAEEKPSRVRGLGRLWLRPKA